MFEAQPSSVPALDALCPQLQARLDNGIGAHNVASLAIQFDCAHDGASVELNCRGGIDHGRCPAPIFGLQHYQEHDRGACAAACASAPL